MGAKKALEALLGAVASGRPIRGYVLVSATPRGTVDLEFAKGGQSLTVFLASRTADTAFLSETGRFRIGYRGGASVSDAVAVVEELAAIVRAREELLPPETWDSLAMSDERRCGLVVRGDTLELRVTLRCNERCPFCNTDDSAENVVTKPRDIEAAIRAAPGLGASRVVFTGGEPSLACGLPQWVGLAKCLGLVVSVQSNGLLPGLPTFWKRFEGVGWPDHLYLSFHTTRPGRVEVLTGVAGTFERKVRAVREARRRGVAVGLNFVATSLNLDDLPDLPGFVAREFGTDVPVDLSLVAPNGHCRGRMDLVPRMSEAAPWFAAALDEAARLGMHVEVMEVCGFPPCLIPERPSAFQCVRKARAVTTQHPDRVKAPSCVSCRLDNVCPGVWRRYADRYGLEELRPLR